jgi:ribonuclease T1
MKPIFRTHFAVRLHSGLQPAPRKMEMICHAGVPALFLLTGTKHPVGRLNSIFIIISTILIVASLTFISAGCGSTSINTASVNTPVNTTPVSTASLSTASLSTTTTLPRTQQPTSVRSTAPAASPLNANQIRISDLPPEAKNTLQLIKKGGPFPYSKDGAVFNNFERLLPVKPSGYYHEYTVDTPGSSDRGARRIVAGSNGEFYYTDDHYNSFKLIVE